MSRHVIDGKDPDLTVTVGWDNPLQTYYAQVERGESDSDDLVLWAGTRNYEYRTPEALAEPLAPYADLTPATLQQLQQDRVIEQTQEPTPSRVQRIWRGKER
mgnify:CR=1 FL=1